MVVGQDSSRWSVEKAQNWYGGLPWLVGCNFIPSTAINQLEMWQAETFDPETIERELGWAADIGFNVIRVYLHDLLWDGSPDGFSVRIDTLLGLASHLGIRPIFVIFDDCWNDTPEVGKQPKPIPGVHNSGWLQSPGRKIVNNPVEWRRLERYVKGLLKKFSEDERILAWDLFNEPGNHGQGLLSLPLLKQTFAWAREANPSQPLTAGLWCDEAEFNEFQLGVSDIITFHNYEGVEKLAAQIDNLEPHSRPLICTEWLRRPISTVEECLPVFQREHVGCLNWGLVSGKTQTIYPWFSRMDGPEPEVWFHDLLHPDGRPYDEQEVGLIKKLKL